ncbi:glutathione S-transferase family protein [Bradyrhizobium sp. Ash2021]|uniref:glutathione S-transferase family protein n=1 Tax=Bradyrhizobium sp. Ash2021 TaxID=2954771 RepID=UPI002816473A|nr:glutathione S-transferase family protein [Bradyrhizobium sp. Ash2021]WMT76446.1 glutathione S-transferase family protein [Bradyrhizobium sp. Ash2021]
MFLNYKGIQYVPHHINISENANISEYFLGINPRGLVPVLVHDGSVHIESNDILVYLEDLFPEPALIPTAARDEISRLLRHENDLHLDLRTISFRFLIAPVRPPKSSDDLDRYGRLGTGTVGGVPDKRLDVEIEFWRDVAETGISNGAAQSAALKFQEAFTELDRRLSGQPYFMGKTLSVLDIAWLVYVNRLDLAGYPLAALHPRLAAWASRLSQHPAFKDELALPPDLVQLVARRRQALELAGGTLVQVCNLS